MTSSSLSIQYRIVAPDFEEHLRHATDVKIQTMAVYCEERTSSGNGRRWLGAQPLNFKKEREHLKIWLKSWQL